MANTNFPTLGSAVLHLSKYHHGEHLDRLNTLARQDPEWVRNVADIMVSYDGHSEEEKKMILKWSIKEKFTQAVNA